MSNPPLACDFDFVQGKTFTDFQWSCRPCISVRGDGRLCSCLPYRAARSRMCVNPNLHVILILCKAMHWSSVEQQAVRYCWWGWEAVWLS